jgi:hypothetical protein
MITSANIFTNIQTGEEYLPETNLSVIYQIHCTETNKCPVKIWSFYSNEPITFPEGSFIQGAIYPIVLYRMEFDEEMASFIGYRSSANIGFPRYIPKNWKPSK